MQGRLKGKITKRIDTHVGGKGIELGLIFDGTNNMNQMDLHEPMVIRAMFNSIYPMLKRRKIKQRGMVMSALKDTVRKLWEY